MKRLQWFLAAVLVGGFGAAWADGGGTIYSNGVATTVAGAYAYAVPDLFDASKQAVVVVLSSEPIDAAAYDAAADRNKAFDDNLFWNNERKPTSAKLTIGTNKDAPIEQANLAVLSGEGLHSSGSMGTAFYKLDLKSNDGKRIEGTLRSTHESEKTAKDGTYYDVHFALNVANGPAFGPGLAPDGGEPFKAFHAYERALSHAVFSLDRDSLNGVANTLTDARVKALNQSIKSAKNDDKIKDILRSMRDELPNSARFVSGSVKGDVATLQVKGKLNDAEGNDIGDSAPISVTMKKENGYWCFDRQQKAAASGGKPAPVAAGKGKSGK
ncbi:MAG: hypothetical protein ABI846_14870 [Rudaea sp.]